MVGVPVLKRIHTDPDIYMVEIPFKNLNTESTNCFIVRDGDDTLVVDTGAPTDFGADMLLRAIEESGAKPSDCSFFLTHLHMDHVGLMGSVAQPGATVYVNGCDLALYRRFASGAERVPLKERLLCEGVPPEEADAYVEAAHRFIDPRLFDPYAYDLRMPASGSSLFVGRFDMRVLATPGHTPGHQSLVVPAADAVIGGDHVLEVISPSVACFGGIETGMRDYFASLDRLEREPFDRLLVAHGGLLSRDEALARIAWLRGHHLERMDAMVFYAEKGGAQSAYDIIRQVQWNVPVDSWRQISVAQRWCVISHGLAMIAYLVDSGRLRLTGAYEGAEGCEDRGMRLYEAVYSGRGADARGHSSCAVDAREESGIS